MTRIMTPAAALVGLMLTPAFGASTAGRVTNHIQRELRHESLMLSRYGVFDNIEYRVDGAQVTLMGQEGGL